MKMPEARLGIIFIPGWDFSAKNAAYGILLFDLIGLIAGSLTAYRFMDHAAHLGGALFGLLVICLATSYRRDIKSRDSDCMRFMARNSTVQSCNLTFTGRSQKKIRGE